MVTRIQSPRTKRLRRKRKRRNRFTWAAIVLCGILLYGVASFTGSLSDTEPELSSGRTVQVYNMDTEQLMTLDLEQYLTGVVAAEMPASFSEEALKAQAVCARSFIAVALRVVIYSLSIELIFHIRRCEWLAGGIDP